MSGFPTPHLEKLTATHENDKLPACDKPRVERAIERYHEWIKALDAVSDKTPGKRLEKLVGLLNEYRLWVDVELIFDSEDNSAVSGARYYLLCEWLDMTPVSTAATDIDEVIILRKSKRLGSNVRSNFGSVKGRKKYRAQYIKHLTDNPLRIEMFQRFLGHVRGLLQSEAPVESDVLSKGYF